MMRCRAFCLDAAFPISVVLVVGVCAAPAWSFCGFFAGVSDSGMMNSSTQTVFVRDGRSTTLTLSFDYRGDASDFSVIFPVPVVLGEEDVRVVDRGLIERVPRKHVQDGPEHCCKYRLAKVALPSGGHRPVPSTQPS